MYLYIWSSEKMMSVYCYDKAVTVAVQ